MNRNLDIATVVGGLIALLFILLGFGIGWLGVAILVLVLEDTISEDYAPFRKGRGPREIVLTGDTDVNVNVNHTKENA